MELRNQDFKKPSPCFSKGFVFQFPSYTSGIIRGLNKKSMVGQFHKAIQIQIDTTNPLPSPWDPPQKKKTQHQVAGDNLIAKWWRKQHNLASHPTIFVESSHNQHLGTHRHLYASMFTKEILGKPCNSCSDFLWRFLENGCLAFGRVTLSGQSVLQTTFDNEFILICDIYPWRLTAGT